MSEVVVRGISHVSKIDRGRAGGAGGINHFAESGILITFPAGLDNKVCKTPVQDRKECIDVNLVEAAGGFPVWFKEGVRGIRVSKDVCRRTIAGDELVLSVIQFFRKLLIEHEQKVCQCLGIQFTALPIESRL